MQRIPGWSHASLGSLFRDKVVSGEMNLVDAQNLRDTIAAGQMVETVIDEIITTAITPVDYYTFSLILLFQLG